MEISRQGFTCAYGRFQALGEDRVETAKLKQLFLPAMTPEAKKLLRDKHYFVSAQLQHYGVQDAAQAGFGQGANVLKKALAAGKCDKVPDHLVTLEREMRAEWLATRSLSDLAENPQWAMEKYFLDAAGKPDSAKTTGVVGFPLPPFSSYRVSQLREAANRVPGLYEQTARGPSTQTVFIGWDERAVKTTFDFGILEGVMMLSADKGALGEGDEDEDDDDGYGYGLPTTGSKRKATNGGHSAPPKTKAKKTASATASATQLFIVCKSRETGEGEIQPQVERGSMTFKPGFVSFTAQLGMPCVGRNVPFSARKISDTAVKSHDQWDNYSWAAYEHARVSRW